MNLFCFTLDGSTESIYEPAYSKTLKEAPPNHQCSPALLRRRLEWGGSEPSIYSSTVKEKKNNRRSCVTTSALDDGTLEKDINHYCWISSGDRTNLSHPITVQNRGVCKSNMVTSDDRGAELSSDRTHTHLPAQAGGTAESAHSTGRLKKLQNLVQAKKGHLSRAGSRRSTGDNDLSDTNPVLTCMGLGMRPEKKAPSALQQEHQAREDPASEDGVWSPSLGNHLWSPFEGPQPRTPFYHTCHRPRHELWACGGNVSLPRTTEWDRFESLIRELDGKQPFPSPPQTIGSVTDLQRSRNTLTRFDTFKEPLMKPRDNGNSTQEQNGDPTDLKLQRRKMETSSRCEWKHVKASPGKTGIPNGNAKKDGGGGRLGNSVESLCSLNSGQSSSSGVTSGSDCSSNRDSLRLEDELLCTRQVSGRARVHTGFVPSPYDTESLKLEVGDVIEIITKPPMGIWTGMLNGRIGNFKFVYVDELKEAGPGTHEDTQAHGKRQESTVQEVLRRLSLEEYSSSLQLNGYQTVDDLMTLREHHLMGLNLTDPEHRHRLLAAISSLQQLSADGANQGAETPSEQVKADVHNCPRDSGCHLPCSSPANSTEDDLHLLSEYPLAAETTAS